MSLNQGWGRVMMWTCTVSRLEWEGGDRDGNSSFSPFNLAGA